MVFLFIYTIVLAFASKQRFVGAILFYRKHYLEGGSGGIWLRICVRRRDEYNTPSRFSPTPSLTISINVTHLKELQIGT
jgi:hypothetical protein